MKWKKQKCGPFETLWPVAYLFLFYVKLFLYLIIFSTYMNHKILYSSYSALILFLLKIEVIGKHLLVDSFGLCFVTTQAPFL